MSGHDSPASVTLDDLADALVRASRALVGVAVRSVNGAAVDVTLTQHRVLVLLAARGPQTVGAVGAGIGMDASGASRVCARLERLGLLFRAPSADDGRAVLVGLTDAGRALLDEIFARRREEVVRILGGVDLVRVEAMIEALIAFSDASEEVHDWTPV